MKGKRIVINNVKDVVLENYDLKDVLDEEECIIKANVSLISAGTELSRVYGLKEGATYPFYPGYCAVGTIVKKNESLKNFAVGDRVLYSGKHASFQVFNRKKSDGGIFYKLDKRISDEEATFLIMAWIAMNGILPIDLKLSDNVAVFGLGTLGQILVQLYKIMGANVLALDTSKFRSATAKRFMVNTIDCEAKDQYAKIMQVTDNKGCDVVIDATGNSRCIETCFEVAANYAKVILLGSPRVSYETNITKSLSHIHRKMLNVIGGFNRRYPYYEKEGSNECIETYLQKLEALIIAKKLHVKELVSMEIKPEEALKAYEALMEQKESINSVIINWK